MKTTPTAEKLITRATEHIARDLARLPLAEVSRLPRVDRSGLPISIKVSLYGRGAFRYVEAKLGHHPGYSHHSDPRLLDMVLNGQADAVLLRARKHVEMAIEDAQVRHRLTAANGSAT